ncbi:hypothetical protein JD844_018436 [Phrynosoma platyrhinos]|uniref:Interleukin-20 n=1 Tax=Phrynosoma platyrhinos TaxID=52577 RepID=A0ABQ7SNN0_PHRPL|nr:hypothetical protein JD844_018436 [Phrynosoma platyrhinos]
MEGVCFPLLLCTTFLLCLMPSSSPKRLHFGHCMVSVDMYEIRKGFGDIKQMTAEDRCCFFHSLLRFYLMNVFNQCREGSNFHQRRVSRIANNFLSIKKELTLCDAVTTCPCGKEANQRYEEILTQFQQVNVFSTCNLATGNAGDLLNW